MKKAQLLMAVLIVLLASGLALADSGISLPIDEVQINVRIDEGLLLIKGTATVDNLCDCSLSLEVLEKDGQLVLDAKTQSCDEQGVELTCKVTKKLAKIPLGEYDLMWDGTVLGSLLVREGHNARYTAND